MEQKHIINAIKAKKWITIQYNQDHEPITTIKPIFIADSSFGDYFVYAWGWHSGEPGYYRFDIEKIHKVIPVKGSDLDNNEDRQRFVYPSWVAMLYDYRDDYLTWIKSDLS